MRTRQIIGLVFSGLFLAGIAVADSPLQKTKSVDEIRNNFLKLIDRPKVPLAEHETLIDLEKGFDAIEFSFASEAAVRVPGILVRINSEKVNAGADTRKLPVVIVMHGTGGSKTGEVGRLKKFAAAGFIAIAIDGRYHGARGTPAQYNQAIADAFVDGKSHPLYFDTAWDIMRLIDYLETRPDVDAKKIGLMGISKGGIETWLTSAIDPRVAAAVPCIGMQSFKWALENDNWKARVGTVKKGFEAATKSAGVDVPDAKFVKSFYDKLIPGIDGEFDGPSMVTLISPRPLLIINGDKDSLTPLPGLKLCSDAAKIAYEKAGKSEQFSQIIQKDTGHKVNPESDKAAVEWFTKWLKN